MTWRRFCVLLGGLSPSSLWAQLYASDAGDGGKRVIEDAGEAEAFTAQLAARR